MTDFFDEGKGQSDGSSFDLTYYFSKLIANFVWILLSILIALTGAYFYLRYSTPKYQLTGYIIVGGRAIENGANDILANAGLVSGEGNNLSQVSNEIFILKSHKLNSQVVDSLRLNIGISRKGHLKDQPMMLSSMPITIDVHKKEPNSGSKLILKTQPNAFTLSNEQKTFRGNYGQPIVVGNDTILIQRKASQPVSTDEYTLELLGKIPTVKMYQSRLAVEQAKNGGMGLLKVSVVDEVPERAREYIQVLIHSYNTSYLEYQNQAIKSALVFLGDRLETVNGELSQQENALKDFKSSNQLYDISSSAQELLTTMQNLDVQKSQNAYQSDLLALIENSINKPSGGEDIIVSTSGIQDPVLAAQVAKYNDLVFKKQTVQSSGAEADPRLGPINDQLADFRTNIQKNINNIRRQFGVASQNTSEQERRYASKFQVLPEKEKQYVELNRKFNIKEQQYVYLLQKKEETELQLVSSNAERSRTVDDILNEGAVSPVRMMVYAIAVILGILLPALYILIKVIVNQKIETRKEIEKGTSVPILGELNLGNTDEPIAISTNKRTAIAEQLRAIRTNLSFMGSSTAQQVFIITSSISGEGKSFVSLNLGNSLAISNKRVAVLELDLRKPMLSKNLGVNNKVGISNFIVNEKMQPQEIIQEVAGCPNLFLLNSGPIPPNPGELIISERLGQLISYLRTEFDVVILDSPPVGLVADSLSLAKHADLSLFVLRPNHSLRSAIPLVNDLQTGQKLPKLSLIINGIQPEKGYGGYGNYGGKGYGYYSDDEVSETQLLKKIKSLFNRL